MDLAAYCFISVVRVVVSFSLLIHGVELLLKQLFLVLLFVLGSICECLRGKFVALLALFIDLIDVVV